MINKLKETFRRIYMKSYGMDDLNKYLLFIVLTLSLLNVFLKSQVLGFIYYVLDFYLLFRFFSRKKYARSEENRKFRKIIKFLKIWYENRKTHKVFMCHKCGQIIRVPRGRGKIEVTCPSCKTLIDTRS